MTTPGPVGTGIVQLLKWQPMQQVQNDGRSRAASIFRRNWCSCSSIDQSRSRCQKEYHCGRYDQAPKTLWSRRHNSMKTEQKSTNVANCRGFPLRQFWGTLAGFCWTWEMITSWDSASVAEYKALPEQAMPCWKGIYEKWYLHGWDWDEEHSDDRRWHITLDFGGFSQLGCFTQNSFWFHLGSCQYVLCSAGLVDTRDFWTPLSTTCSFKPRLWRMLPKPKWRNTG